MKAETDFLNKYNNCIDTTKYKKRTRDTIIKVEENKRIYLLKNDSEFCITKIKVEQCVTFGHGEKGCEAILYVELLKQKKYSAVKAFFIELKGCSVGDALKQIDNSLETAKQYLKNVTLFGRIVPSEYKHPHFIKAAEQRLSIKFKKTGGDLIIKEKLSDKI